MWRRYDIWVDAGGRTRLISNNYAAAPFGNLDAELMSISNAGIFQSTGGNVTNVGVVPAAAQFPSVLDIATITLTDAGGLEMAILVPAPLESIFLADLTTVKPSILADVLAAAVADGYTSAVGNAPVAAIAGLRSGRRPT